MNLLKDFLYNFAAPLIFPLEEICIESNNLFLKGVMDLFHGQGIWPSSKILLPVAKHLAHPLVVWEVVMNSDLGPNCVRSKDIKSCTYYQCATLIVFVKCLGIKQPQPVNLPVKTSSKRSYNKRVDCLQ